MDPHRHAPVRRVVASASLMALMLGCQSQPPAPAPAGRPSSQSQTAIPAAAPANSAPPAHAGTLTFGLDQEPLTLDPHSMTTTWSIAITTSVGESLVYLDEHHVLQPWLAERWEVGDGGASFIFHLRPDVTFQDGTAFNAAAVKWNFDRIVDPTFKPGQSASFLAGYQGTDLLDELTVRVRFAQPFVPFLELAAGNQLSMLSPTAPANKGTQANATPVMSGPYRIDEWVAKDHVTLSRWEGYQRRAPWSDHTGPGYLDRIVWKFIPDQATRIATVESGETQMTWALTPPDVARLQADGLQTLGTPWGGTPVVLLLNVTQPPTNELAVRQAIGYAVDVDPLLAREYAGTPPIGPLTSVVLDDPTLRGIERHTPARASQVLSDAGWTMQPDGIRARNGQRLQFVFNKRADASSGPQVLLQAQLREVGIDVAIKNQALGAFNEDNARCVDNGALWAVRTGGMDALYPLYHSSNVGTGLNWSCVKDAAIDQALVQGRQEVDPARRKQLYVQLEHTLLDMAVVVPLVDQVNMFGLRPNLAGLKFSGYSYPLLTDITVTS